MKYLSLFIAFVLLISSCNNAGGKKEESGKEPQPDMVLVEKLSADLKNEPKNAALYFKRGQAYRAVKMDSLALMDFQKATVLDSSQSKYFSAVGDLLFEHKDITGSVPWFQKSLALNPGDEKAHLKMAKLFLYIEEFPKAFVEINTVLRGNVYNAEAYFLKGMCYKSMKDTAKAISSFQTAVQTDPKYVDAHMQLALIYEAKKDPVSLKYFENAYQADTFNMEPLYGQAMYWQNQQNFTEAKKVFKRMILRDRSYAKSYYNTGWMLMQEDSTEKAIRQFDIAIQNKPDYADAYYNRGICKEILGKNADALEDYNQALSFNIDNASYKDAQQRVTQKVK
ncbi:MAG: tetratricopeptide repeat protein [Chitinophagaceae bacterium]|nr:tetratricopeptide repeat protein [Chitinophagaceae bacterium]